MCFVLSWYIVDILKSYQEFWIEIFQNAFLVIPGGLQWQAIILLSLARQFQEE